MHFVVQTSSLRLWNQGQCNTWLVALLLALSCQDRKSNLPDRVRLNIMGMLSLATARTLLLLLLLLLLGLLLIPMLQLLGQLLPAVTAMQHFKQPATVPCRQHSNVES